MAIRVVVADDHEVLREGLVRLFADSDVEVVAEAASGREAVQQVQQLQPDVVLLDIRMADGDGLWALEQIKQQMPAVPVLILSTYDNPTYVAQAMAHGASGYLLKGSPRDEIISKIHAVASGQNVWPADELRRFGRKTADELPTADLEVTLTAREREVLQQVARGHTNKQIGEELHISPETVKEHIQNILRKIGVSDRTQAAVWAVRNGLC